MVRPGDIESRERFASELDRNFSVVASAGSGKTTAIIERVLSIAQSANAVELLPRLVVVTYANRAADEMQQRARQLLLEKNLPPNVQTAFNRAFFGTIHAFCLKLLTDHGHYLGLPAPLELLADDDDLWHEFVQGQTRIGHSLGEENRAALLRLVQARDLMDLARRSKTETLSASEFSPCPAPAFTEVHAQTDRRDSDTVSKSQAELRDWEKRYAADWEFLRWPVCFSTPTSKFTEVWQKAFSPLRKWICNLAACVAAEIQHDYREFRLERGLVTYDDQVALAKELLHHPIAGPRVREEGFRVILDEAQDTAPSQFDVLLEASRPPEAAGIWPSEASHLPRAGHFCMVGDFQQSIYRKHSELKYYRRVHDALVATESGAEVEFSVTFRLDKKQLEFVNATFREILNDKNGQVPFVELQPRPGILPGKVIRLPLGKELLEERDKKDYQKARREAEFLARWIKEAGLQKLSADSWREVAILCPRKAWLQTIAAALRREGLPVALQSERDVNGDSPAYAWFTALLTIMTDPRNAYEIVGVLREVFGVSDHDLAVFSEGQGFRFRIDEALAAAGKVSSHLSALAQTRGRLQGLALFDAVTCIAEETQLHDRLLLLPATEFGDLSRELEALLAQAAEAEAGGTTLSEFAERLRNDFTTERTVRFTVDDNAIQLITSQKAKGSEWQAVIVPFLARDLRVPPPRYPDLIKSPDTGDLLIALSAAEKSKELKKALELAHEQEIERLLYVATTRARHTLVLVLDQEIFSNPEGKLPRGAQLRRLIRNADSYSGEFDDHSRTIEEVKHSEGVIASPPSLAAAIEPLASSELKRAKKRASEFVRKFIPSALEAEIDVEFRAHSRLDNLATLYGRWWHKFLERLDWRGGTDSAQKLFDEHRSICPDPKSAMKDWKAMRANLFSDGRITPYLIKGETRFHRELSFAWQINERTVLEGFIDALMVDGDAGRALLLDWKTNRIAKGEEQQLRERYRPQIAAYWKSISEITKLEVEAGLFATATGKFLPYDRAELEAEWKRLRALPPDQLIAEVSTL
jgi:ATP-dependent exoDNAse (exonuclease V) beta subunit